MFEVIGGLLFVIPKCMALEVNPRCAKQSFYEMMITNHYCHPWKLERDHCHQLMDEVNTPCGENWGQQSRQPRRNRHKNNWGVFFKHIFLASALGYEA